MALETTKATKTNTTPKRGRSKSPSPTSDSDRPRKKARGFAQSVAGVCALTNIRGKEVQQVHIIPKDASADLIADLEFAWGIEPATLDMEDTSNLLSLTPKSRESFDAGHWGLMPCDVWVFVRLFEYAEGINCDEIKTVTDIYNALGMTEFTFQIVPLSHFKTVVNRRKNVDSDDPPVACTFQKLPEITLRVQPHLVVVNFVTKYLRLSKEEREAFENWLLRNTATGYSDFRMFRDTYEQWVPSREFDHEYAHLPPLDRKLECLVSPRDSISILSVYGGSDSDNKPEDFFETDAVLKIRIGSWTEAVAKALDEDPTEPPIPTSYPIPPSTPSPPPSPPAPSPDYPSSSGDLLEGAA